ncbi:PCAT1 [Fasciola gigantica]|uniref:PCAT1 n=1 Tax=Fasciola gigantica TaxID=46835 RepID=A0A504Z2N9_FASGI|nr:PCAT1 [Fasciola gigantica]
MGEPFKFLEEQKDVVQEASLLYSPFEYKCNISALNHLKMFILSVLLFPIRLIATGTFFIIALLLSHVMTKGLHKERYPKPDVSLKRRILLPFLVKLSRFVYFCGGIHWVRISGRRATSAEAPILVVAPHSSFLDSLVVVLMGMTSVVTMTQHADSFIGSLIRVLQPVLVNRDDPLSRKKTMEEIYYRAHSYGDWPQLLIFPEGTCTNRSCLVSFKPGAFQPGLAVQPVILRWPNHVDSTTWVWEGPSVLKLLWMTMTQFTTFFEVEFLPVYVPDEEEKLDARLFANNVRRKMAEALKIPTCDLVYDDFCRIRVAVNSKLPNPEAVVYLYSLIRSAFSQRIATNLCVPGDDTYLDSIRSHLNFLLSSARHCPNVTHLELLDFLFPNVRLDQRDTFLLNLIFRHYRSESENKVNFRLLITRVCMFFFASDPLEALRLAIKAYPPVGSTPSLILLEQENISTAWRIETDNAKELLSGLFLFEPGASTADEIVKLACTKLNSSSSNVVDEVDAVCADQLYDGLCSKANEKLYCYASFEDELRRIFGSRGQPLIKSKSASTSQISLSSLIDSDKPEKSGILDCVSCGRDVMLWTIEKSDAINVKHAKPSEVNGTPVNERTHSVAYLRPVHNT